jgi:hypothetical protein
MFVNHSGIASVSGTESPGFGSRQGVRIRGKNLAVPVCQMDYSSIVLELRNKGIGPQQKDGKYAKDYDGTQSIQ